MRCSICHVHRTLMYMRAVCGKKNLCGCRSIRVMEPNARIDGKRVCCYPGADNACAKANRETGRNQTHSEATEANCKAGPVPRWLNLQECPDLVRVAESFANNSPEQKPIWEMPFAEIGAVRERPFREGQTKLYGCSHLVYHCVFVDWALAYGKPIPPRVLQEYPDLRA